MNSLTSAVAAVIADSAGRVLLCQQSQGHRLWSLPGGKIQLDESPLHAAVRDIRAEVGADVTLLGLIGMYQLTDGDGHRDTGLGDVLVHVFRARVDGEVTVNSPGMIARLCWHDPSVLPSPTTATTRAAIEDAVAGRSGMIRTVRRAVEPDIPEAVSAAA
jgi:8-oxo-dGTP diphosphatase